MTYRLPIGQDLRRKYEDGTLGPVAGCEQIREAMGLKRLPDHSGILSYLVVDTIVMVLPRKLAQVRHPNSTRPHRMYAVCNHCKKEIPTGRFGQHLKVHAEIKEQQDIENLRIRTALKGRYAGAKISITTGTEGPAHDPYHFTEYKITRLKVGGGEDVFVMHQGLGTWLSANNVSFGRYDDIILAVAFEQFTQTNVSKLHQYNAKVHGPFSRCPKCNSHKLNWGDGYVGEQLQYCMDCGDVCYCEPVTESMI